MYFNRFMMHLLTFSCYTGVATSKGQIDPCLVYESYEYFISIERQQYIWLIGEDSFFMFDT